MHMWAKDRHHRIISLLAVKDRISIDELIADLNVSRESVRRDIQTLELAGKLKKVYGGVTRAPSATEAPLKTRMQEHADAKRRIGAAAARLLKPGMLCAVDSGSTTHALAKSLAGLPQLSVVTNSLNIASLLGDVAELELILLGGRVRSDMPGTYGELAMSEMARFSPDIAFFSPVAVHPKHGATSYQLPEVEFARTMIAKAHRVVMLADSSKLGTSSRIQVCECKRVDTLVTDKKATQEQIAALRSAGIGEILIA